MSRNRNLRKIAAGLPVMYKRGKDGRPLFNEKGEIMEVDHFREILEIKRGVRERMGMVAANEARIRKEEIMAIGDYCSGVQKIGKARKVKDVRYVITAITTFFVIIFIAIKYLRK